MICRVYCYAGFELPYTGEFLSVVIEKTYLLWSFTQVKVKLPLRNHKKSSSVRKKISLSLCLSARDRTFSTCNKNSKTLPKIWFCKMGVSPYASYVSMLFSTRTYTSPSTPNWQRPTPHPPVGWCEKNQKVAPLWLAPQHSTALRPNPPLITSYPWRIHG